MSPIKYALPAALMCGIISVDTAMAASAAWNVDVSGNYSTGSNWNPTAAPGTAGTGTGSTDVATFKRSTITANRTITFDADYNLAGITFDNDSSAANAYSIGAATFGSATAGTLSLSAGAVIQNIGSGSSTTGANGIDAKIILNGSATFSNSYKDTVLNVATSAGTTANTFTTAQSLGAIDLTFSGTSTGSSLFSMQILPGSGTTLRIVKQGTGTWQFNGRTSGNQSIGGGFLVRQGTVVLGRSSALSIGTQTVTIGDANTVAGDIRLNLGSNVNVSNAITVAASAAGNVYLERGGGSGAGTFSGGISVARDVVFRQNSTANQILAISGAITGTGNVSVGSSVASPGAVNFSNANALNMVGKFTNASTLATGAVTVSGIVGGNVTEVVQNSSTSAMTLSNGSNAYDKTTVSAGTLTVSSTGKLGTGDVAVAGSGAILTLQTNAAIADNARLSFQNLAAVNLNFTGTDIIGTLRNTSTNTFMGIGTWNAANLNSFFGGSVFSGTGSLQITAVPEPTSLAMLAIGAMGLIRRRRVS